MPFLTRSGMTVESDEMTLTSSPENSPIERPPPLSRSNTNTSTTVRTYARDLLLALATPIAKPPQRLNSFSVIHRDSCQWGVDEESSTTLNGDPVSKSLPIPRQAELVGMEGHGHPADVLFNFQSTPGDRAPILVGFNDPFNPTRKASHVFSSPPGTDNAQEGETMAQTMGEKFASLRFGAKSRGSSFSSGDFTARMSRSSSISSTSSGLNAFAAPWPLPETTPKVITPRVSLPAASSPERVQASLPLPKPSTALPLPASLPPKPNGCLPPIFVKRESAALPQPMAQPDVAPLGDAWEGEHGLSGNDKRRRASAMGLPPLPLPRESLSIHRWPSKSLDTRRPAHLVRMGHAWRSSVSQPGKV